MERSRIPNRLKRYRRLAGYSQKTVARLIGRSTTGSLSKWEKGRSMPPIPIVFKLSLLYQTHPIHLYQDLWQELKLALEGKQGLSSQQENIKNNCSEYL